MLSYLKNWVLLYVLYVYRVSQEKLPTVFTEIALEILHKETQF